MQKAETSAAASGCSSQNRLRERAARKPSAEYAVSVPPAVAGCTATLLRADFGSDDWLFSGGFFGAGHYFKDRHLFFDHLFGNDDLGDVLFGRQDVH